MQSKQSEQSKFSLIEHHLKVKSILNKRVKAGELTDEEALKLYANWLKERRLELEKIEELLKEAERQRMLQRRAEQK